MKEMSLALSNKNKSYLESYLHSLRLRNKSEHTLKNYRVDIEAFLKWFEVFHHGDLTAANGQSITAYKDYLAGLEVKKRLPFWKRLMLKFLPKIWRKNDRRFFRDYTLAVASKRRHLSSLKNFFQYLQEAHQDQGKKFLINPVKPKLHTIGLKDKDVNHTKTLTPDDFEKLYEAVTKVQDRLAICLLYYGALRVEELSQLRVDQFHHDSQSLSFYRKGGSLHTLRLINYQQIERWLYAYLAQKNPGPWLFANKKGQPFTTRTHYNRLMKLFKKAGLSADLGPHSFRKGRATELYRQTKDLLYVRDYLNHRDAKVTQTYIDTQSLYS